MTEHLTKVKLFKSIIISAAILILAMLVCACLGSERISVVDIIKGTAQDTDYQIFINVRLPRIVLASLVGAALACAGVVLQAILRNPLADPYILGISSGSGLGVIVAVLLGMTGSNLFGTTINTFAFAGALLTVWLVWFIGHFAAKSNITHLLLAGVVINAFFSSIIMFLISIARSHQLRTTTFWLMGNITEKPSSALVVSAVCITASLLGMMAMAQKLNVLSLGHTQATSLGVNTFRTRLLAFALAAFITSVAVGLSGLVGFVGLIVPHAIRLVLGPDHRRLLPISALIGAAFVVIADTIARIIIAPAQLPVGVITAIAGGPFFLILLARYSRKVSWAK